VLVPTHEASRAWSDEGVEGRLYKNRPQQLQGSSSSSSVRWWSCCEK
jgi:hypothetical protein